MTLRDAGKVSAATIASGRHIDDQEQHESAEGVRSAHPEVTPHRPISDKSWFKFKDKPDGIPVDYEYIVEGLLRFGHNALSGPRGSGKSSTLVPLLLAIAGFLPDYPLQIKLRRQVIMVTEDETQVWRVIDAMRADGYLEASFEQIKDWFLVSDSQRLTAEEVIKHAHELETMMIPNPAAGGSNYLAGPLVVLDTVSANLDIENGSNNDDVAKDVTKIREALPHVAILLVGHTAKDAANKAGQTFLGAQAWEAVTIGALTLQQKSDDERYLISNKNRFSAEHTTFKVVGNLVEYQGVDAMGYATTIRQHYNLIYPLTSVELSEIEAADKSAKMAISEQEAERLVLSELHDMISESGGQDIRTGELQEALGGRKERWRGAIDRLVDSGKITQVTEGRNKLLSIPEDDSIPF